VPTADVFDALRSLRRALSSAAASAFADTGAGGRQVVVLRELRRTGGVSQAELSRATLTDPAGMMRTLAALERRGWIVRAGCADDRRRKLVSLTPAGRRALAELDRPFEALLARANRALTGSERERFCETAEKLAAALRDDAAPAAKPLPTPEPVPAPGARSRR
jgi:MarR family transcriptional regulator for hemolysin